MYNEKFLYSYQKNTEKREPFNQELLNYRRDEDLCYLFENICKSLEIIDGITFLGCSIEKNNKIYENKKGKQKEVHIESSRFHIVKMKFKLQHKEEVKYKELTIYYPELIDGQYFIINGNKYCPALQLVDSECYSTSVGITLKTTLMPINLRQEKFVLQDIYKRMDEYKTLILKLNIFRVKFNPFHYYFSKFGVDKTLEFFKFSKGDESFISIDSEPLDDKNLSNEDSEIYSFMANSNIYVNVWKEWLDEDFENRSILVATLINAFKGRMNLDNIQSIDFWKKKLGGYITKNTSNVIEKSNSLISSLERVLDETTKNILRIEPEDKEDVYCVIRWMMINYNTIYNIDNMDLANKRIRINEYLLYSLTNKFSKAVYRLMNKKTITMKTLESIFSNIKEEFLIKNISRDNSVRYSNQVNTIDLFVYLKGTVNGPQAQNDNGGGNVRTKSIDTSYVGKLDLCATSSNDPGSSFTVTPFCPIYDKFYFTKEPALKTKSIKDIEI